MVLYAPGRPDPKADDVFDLRGIDRDAGCMVLVRTSGVPARTRGSDVTYGCCWAPGC